MQRTKLSSRTKPTERRRCGARPCCPNIPSHHALQLHQAALYNTRNGMYCVATEQQIEYVVWIVYEQELLDDYSETLSRIFEVKLPWALQREAPPVSPANMQSHTRKSHATAHTQYCRRTSSRTGATWWM